MYTVKSKLLILSMSMFCCLSLSGQPEVDIFLQAGVDDGEHLIEDYLRPVFNALGYGYNGCWYQTARTHDQFGFDVTLGVNAAIVPGNATTFTYQSSRYNNILLSDPSQNHLATVFGPASKSERPELTFVNDAGQEVIRVTSQPGIVDMRKRIALNAVPVPVAHIGIGVYKNTDLKFRIIPGIRTEDVSFSMIGGGIQHDVKQWIPALEIFPFHLSVIAAYSTSRLEVSLEEKNEPSTEGNKGVLRMSGFTFQGVISQEYGIFTLYGGVGYASAGSRTQILGTYEVDEDFDPIPDDPIDLKYSNGTLTATGGIRMKIALLTTNLAFSLQEYSLITAGVGLSFR